MSDQVSRFGAGRKLVFKLPERFFIGHTQYLGGKGFKLDEANVHSLQLIQCIRWRQ